MKWIRTSITCLLCSGTVFGQTIIVNGGFEQYDCLPNDFTQIECATGWSNPVSQSCNTSQGDVCATPDYYHISGMGYGQLPNTNAARIFPYEGNAVAGLIAWNALGVREYLTYSLDIEIIPAVRYLVQFHTSNGVTNEQSTFGAGWGIDGFGLALSTIKPVQPDFDTLSIRALFTIDSILFSSTWMKHSFQFTSDSSYRYLTIGNFNSNTATSAQEIVMTNAIGNTAYYFIDDVSIVRLDTVNSVYEWEDAVRTFSQTDEKISIGFDERIRKSTALLYDMAGRRVGNAQGNGRSLSLSISHLPKGIYALQLQTDVGMVSRKVVIP